MKFGKHGSFPTNMWGLSFKTSLQLTLAIIGAGSPGFMCKSTDKKIFTAFKGSEKNGY